MHIPDGWLSLSVSLVTWALTLISLGFAISKVKKSDLGKLSNIGAIAAVVFVAQMFNFPVAGGTSGHLLGAALSVYVVGLPGAIITLFVVLMVQAIVFADGGILALGANTFNMGIVGSLIAWGFIKTFKRFKNRENKVLYLSGAFISAFLAVLVSSFMAGIELVLSGTAEFSVSVPLILFWHLFIGVGEGLLTIFIISYMLQVKFPLADEIDSEGTLVDVVKESNKPLIGFGFLLLILSLLSLIASSSPDGLEFIGALQDFGSGNSFSAGIADNYSIFGLDSLVGTFLSALLGIMVIAGIFLLPVFYMKSKGNPQ